MPILEESVLLAFDDKCILCNNAVHFIIKHDSKHHLKFISLDLAIEKGVIPIEYQESKSFVLVEESNLYKKSAAAFRTAKYLDTPYFLLGYLRIFPKFLTDFVYDIVAKYRYRWFGRTEQCMILNASNKDRFILS